MKKTERTPDFEKLRATCVQAALAGGDVLRKYFRKRIAVREKPDAGLVTVADLQAEEAVLKILTRKYPEFGILAEESQPGSTGKASTGRFVIDPLDGTTNFVHGFPMFCVSVGAEWKGKRSVGVIHHPIFNETYVAVRGKGAYLHALGTKSRLRVSSTRKIPNALLTTGFNYHKKEFLSQELRTFGNLSRIARAIRRPGSAALDLAYTARGVFDAFWERNLAPWDTAAGALLVEEAGGKVTDFSGGPYRSELPQILASNKKLHPALLKSL